jgi:hypothetical protein
MSEEKEQEDKELLDYQRKQREYAEKRLENKWKYHEEHKGIYKAQSKKNNTKERQKIIEEYRKQNNIEAPKCISDQVLLYLRYGMDNAYHYKRSFNMAITAEKEKVEFSDEEKEWMLETLYKTLRGDPEFTSKVPSHMAMGILYIATVMCDIYLTQTEVAEIYHSTPVTVRTSYKIVKRLYNKLKQRVEL